MTALDLDAIRERWAKATPGPWESDGKIMAWWGGKQPGVMVRRAGWNGGGQCVADVHKATGNICGSLTPVQDAAAIAAAPDDIAALLAEVERLRRIEVAARRLLAEVDELHPAGLSSTWQMREALAALRDNAPEPRS